MRSRIGFLPVFFVTLGIVVLVIAVLRIRSYEKAAPRPVSAGATTSSAPEPVASQTITPVPLIEPPSPRTTTSTTALVSEPDASAPRPTAPALRTVPATVKPTQRVAAAVPAPAPQPRAQTAAPATPAQRPARETASVADTAPSRRDTTSPPPEEEPKTDPTSDNLPPRLMAISFSPPQVQDGQETILHIEAVDELAGVRSISGTILAPSGAVQGFACSREGSTNRYQSRIVVPKAAADGLWRVNYLALTDLANNTAALSMANGMIPPSASFQVVSAESDNKGPTLRAVFLARRSMQSGEKNTVTIQADDDKSGVHNVSGVFQSPSRVARIGFVCHGRTPDTFECEVTAPACADCGDWRLEQVQLQDKANNITTVRADNPIVNPVLLDISSAQCDSTPPAVETVTLDKKVVSNTTSTMVSVFVGLTDDACGIQSLSGQIMGPPGPEGAPSNSFTFVQDRDPRTWVGRFNVPQLAAKGTWRVSWLQVLDRGRNLRTYSQNDPVLSGATFVVE
jgi:hypothetical protein